MVIEKWALYARVSTGGQFTENQELILRDHASRLGWTFDYYEEKESTRKTRPVKYDLLQKLRGGEYKGVCIVRLDRWARSTIELVTEVTELYKKKVFFVSLRNQIDLSSPEGRFQFRMFANIAELERDLIQERTLEGLARARAQGKQLGRPKGSKDKIVRKIDGYVLRYKRPKSKNSLP